MLKQRRRRWKHIFILQLKTTKLRCWQHFAKYFNTKGVKLLYYHILSYWDQKVSGYSIKSRISDLGERQLGHTGVIFPMYIGGKTAFMTMNQWSWLHSDSQAIITTKAKRPAGWSSKNKNKLFRCAIKYNFISIDILAVKSVECMIKKSCDFVHWWRPLCWTLQSVIVRLYFFLWASLNTWRYWSDPHIWWSGSKCESD